MTYRTDIAPSSASRCRGCGNKILKGIKRIFRMEKTGNYGASPYYFCPACAKKVILENIKEDLTAYSKVVNEPFDIEKLLKEMVIDAL